MQQSSIWERLQGIDRRVIYGLLLAAILLPMFLSHVKIPVVPDPPARKFYDTVERIALEEPQKLVIVDAEWSPSTRGENKWQSVAIINHLMKRHIRFALLTFNPQTNKLMQDIVDDLEKEHHYGCVYGRDYVNFGYKPASAYLPTLKGLTNNISGAIKKDWKGTDVATLPVMHGVKNIKDVSALVIISPSATVEGWIGLVQGVNKTPLLYAPTAIMAPKAYAQLDSGQITGMLTGVKGAGDYESLTGTSSFGTRATGALSFVYALVIFLIILGNVGYYMGRAQERRASR
jgi:hypothetical protein